MNTNPRWPPFPPDLDEREAEWENDPPSLTAALAHLDLLDRLTVSGALAMPPRRRRRMIRDGFGGIVALALLTVLGFVLAMSVD